MVTEAPAAFLVRKHEATTRIRGNGQEPLLELTKKYFEVMDQTIRSKTAEPMATSMTDGQDPDEYFPRTTLVRGQVQRIGEHVSDRRVKDIMVQGLTTDYREVN